MHTRISHLLFLGGPMQYGKWIK